jgi:TatD DNase family protein
VLLVDSHSHIDAAEFDADRPAVIAAARAAGVAWQVVPAVGAAHFAALRTLCADEAGLLPAYGLHPVYLAEHRDSDLLAVRAELMAGGAFAVGECGLDGFVDGLDWQQQLALFRAQLRLAREFDLPVVVHARRAFDAVAAELRRIGGLRGVVHSFSGSGEQLRQLQRLDFYIGLGGPVTYPRAQRLRRTASEVPIERLLLETDCPDQPDCDHRGQRNEPARLRRVLSEIAELRAIDEAALAEITTANAMRLFGFGG